MCLCVFVEWRLGLVICKLVPYFQGVSVNASINTLMAISVERCLSICYPMNPVGKGVCKRVVAIIWIISLTITMPWAIYFDLQPMEEGSDNQVTFQLTFFFFLIQMGTFAIFYFIVYIVDK